MARVEPPRGKAEPQSAADYDERTVRAVRAVLIVEETDVLQERTADQWQQDAFGQVDVWLRLLGLRTGSRFVPRRTESPRLLEPTGRGIGERGLKEPGR